MRALVLSEFSGPDGIALADGPAPMAGDDGRSVLIEVHAAGVSFADMLITRGLYQLRPELPFVPGLEVAGVVREAAAEPFTVTPIPDRLAFPEAAGFIVNYHTAWLALSRQGRLAPGEQVLVQ